MTLTSALIGGFVGFGCQIASNAARKVPLSREPWMHVLGFIGGCYLGVKLPKFERQLVEDINELRAQKGMSPMVGTNAWIRYRLPEDDENAQLEKK